MKLERAVYDLKQNIVGYMIFKQNINDTNNKEMFIGFKKV